ncbi:MAG: hypothetical protein EXQ71_03460 [Acidimicrobiia bacterium]|nr:hypothetical protein [Acidimicrobiia bacterium]
MARQLTLLTTTSAWRLDDATRELGRRGVAEARASLQAGIAARPDSDTPPEPPSQGRSAA